MTEQTRPSVTGTGDLLTEFALALRDYENEVVKREGGWADPVDEAVGVLDALLRYRREKGSSGD